MFKFGINSEPERHVSLQQLESQRRFYDDLKFYKLNNRRPQSTIFKNWKL